MRYDLKEKIYGNRAIVFHRSKDSDLINIIHKEGFKPGYGAGGLYGPGLYSCYELESQMDLQHKESYGDYIFKFAVNTDRFLFLNYEEFQEQPVYVEWNKEHPKQPITYNNFLQFQFKRFKLFSNYDKKEYLPQYTLNIREKGFSGGYNFAEGLEAYPTNAPKQMTWDEANEYCKSLGEGWRLPTKDELNQMYQLKDEIDGFGEGWLWSSSQSSSSSAWVQLFSDGNQGISTKYNDDSVRAVRDTSSFSLSSDASQDYPPDTFFKVKRLGYKNIAIRTVEGVEALHPINNKTGFPNFEYAKNYPERNIRKGQAVKEGNVKKGDIITFTKVNAKFWHDIDDMVYEKKNTVLEEIQHTLKYFTSDAAKYCWNNIPELKDKVDGLIYTGRQDGLCLLAYNMKIITILSKVPNEVDNEEEEEPIKTIRVAVDVGSYYGERVEILMVYFLEGSDSSGATWNINSGSGATTSTINIHLIGKSIPINIEATKIMQGLSEIDFNLENGYGLFIQYNNDQTPEDALFAAKFNYAHDDIDANIDTFKIQSYLRDIIKGHKIDYVIVGSESGEEIDPIIKVDYLLDLGIGLGRYIRDDKKIEYPSNLEDYYYVVYHDKFYASDKEEKWRGVKDSPDYFSHFNTSYHPDQLKLGIED